MIFKRAIAAIFKSLRNRDCFDGARQNIDEAYEPAKA
jgi:hypothetical protein